MIHKELYYKYHKIMSQSFQNPSFQKDKLFLLLQTDGWGVAFQEFGHTVSEIGRNSMTEGRKKAGTRFHGSMFPRKTLLLYCIHQLTVEWFRMMMRFEADERCFTKNSTTSTTNHVTVFSEPIFSEGQAFSCSLQTDGWGVAFQEFGHTVCEWGVTQV